MTQGGPPSYISPSESDPEPRSLSLPDSHEVCVCRFPRPACADPAALRLASLGSSARLACTLSGGYSVGSRATACFRQRPASPPHYLVSCFSDSPQQRGSGVPSLFSGFNHASANARLLLIPELRPEDEASHHCAAWHRGTKCCTALQPSGKGGYTQCSPCLERSPCSAWDQV